MPFRMLPDSDATARTALRALTRKQNNTPPAEWPYDAARGAENVAALGLLEKEIGERDTANAARSLATSGAEAAMNRTRQSVSHYLQTFNNAIARAVLRREDRAFYELDLDQSDVPAMTSTADVLTWAHNVIQGEARRAAAATAAGTPFLAVSFPSAAEVQTELTALTTLLDAQGVATDRSHDEAQDVEDIRPRVGRAILESWDDIANKYRRLSGPAYRRLAREWGVAFHSRPGEPIEEGVTPGPAETPASSSSSSNPASPTPPTPPTNPGSPPV